MKNSRIPTPKRDKRPRFKVARSCHLARGPRATWHEAPVPYSWFAKSSLPRSSGWHGQSGWHGVTVPPTFSVKYDLFVSI